MNRVYIAGAHSRAATMGHYLTYLNPNLEIEAYLYDNDEDNPTEIDGVPVVKITEDIKFNAEYPAYIATRGINQSRLAEILSKYGIKTIIPVDVSLDRDFRNKYLTKYYESLGRDYRKIDEISIVKESDESTYPTTAVYVASSVNDGELKCKYEIDDFEKVLQVGTALTDKRLKTQFFDNTGDNISDRNSQFCELTGLYWIWKNAKEDLVGLVHYRRHFILPKNWINVVKNAEVDVILPTPLYVGPSIEDNYKFRHIASNWDYMYEFLNENYSDEYESMRRFFRETSLYSPCNMFIMRREILDELCKWMFPIIFAVAELGGVTENKYQNRYPGFISERLISYYFDRNRDKYNVLYADKNFLE